MLKPQDAALTFSDFIGALPPKNHGKVVYGVPPKSTMSYGAFRFGLADVGNDCLHKGKIWMPQASTATHTHTQRSARRPSEVAHGVLAKRSFKATCIGTGMDGRIYTCKHLPSMMPYSCWRSAWFQRLLHALCCRRGPRSEGDRPTMTSNYDLVCTISDGNFTFVFGRIC